MERYSYCVTHMKYEGESDKGFNKLCNWCGHIFPERYSLILAYKDYICSMGAFYPVFSFPVEEILYCPLCLVDFSVNPPEPY